VIQDDSTNTTTLSAARTATAAPHPGMAALLAQLKAASRPPLSRHVRPNGNDPIADAFEALLFALLDEGPTFHIFGGSADAGELEDRGAHICKVIQAVREYFAVVLGDTAALAPSAVLNAEYIDGLFVDAASEITGGCDQGAYQLREGY
jgi:hypothetical protein